MEITFDVKAWTQGALSSPGAPARGRRHRADINAAAQERFWPKEFKPSCPYTAAPAVTGCAPAGRRAQGPAGRPCAAESPTAAIPHNPRRNRIAGTLPARQRQGLTMRTASKLLSSTSCAIWPCDWVCGQASLRCISSGALLPAGNYALPLSSCASNACTFRGKPKRRMKPSASFWLYTSSSSNVT